MDGKKMVAAEEKHLIPLDKVNGYEVRPGFYGINGATALKEKENPMQSCRFRSITGSVVSIP